MPPVRSPACNKPSPCPVFGVGLVTLLRAGLIVVLALQAAVGRSEGTQSNLEAVKAAYLLNFAKNLNIPTNVWASQKAPFVIGVLSDEALRNELRTTTTNAQVGQRPVEVKRVDNADEATGVQLLFIGSTKESTIADQLKVLKRKPIFLVGEHPKFLELGGMARLYLQTNKMVYDIDLDAVNSAGIWVQQKMITNAVRVFVLSENNKLMVSYLLNFARYVEFPRSSWAGSNSAFVIGVLGDNAFCEVVEQNLNGMDSGHEGHKIQVRCYAKAEEAIDAQVLYFGIQNDDALEHELALFKGRPVLLVGVHKNFLKYGGTVRLYPKDTHVFFELNPNLHSANAAGFTISAKMWKAAVPENPATPGDGK